MVLALLKWIATVPLQPSRDSRVQSLGGELYGLMKQGNDDVCVIKLRSFLRVRSHRWTGGKDDNAEK